MKEQEIREGDIVEIDYIDELTQERISEGKALVMWKGFNHQPLIHKLDAKHTIWSGYDRIVKVIGHVDIERYMENAIALEQKPCTDAISREEALEAFKPRGISQDAWEESNVYKTIKALPTVTPERPKGEWVDGICNKCGYDGGIEAISGKADYCSICGADMREVNQ